MFIIWCLQNISKSIFVDWNFATLYFSIFCLAQSFQRIFTVLLLWYFGKGHGLSFIIYGVFFRPGCCVPNLVEISLVVPEERTFKTFNITFCYYLPLERVARGNQLENFFVFCFFFIAHKNTTRYYVSNNITFTPLSLLSSHNWLITSNYPTLYIPVCMRG